MRERNPVGFGFILELIIGKQVIVGSFLNELAELPESGRGTCFLMEQGEPDVPAWLSSNIVWRRLIRARDSVINTAHRGVGGPGAVANIPGAMRAAPACRTSPHVSGRQRYSTTPP